MEISKFRPNYQIITVQGFTKARALILVFFLIYSFFIFALSFIIHLLKPLGSSLFFFIVSEGRCGTGIWTRAAFPTMICLIGAFTSVPLSPHPVLPHYAFISLDSLFIFYFRSTFGVLLISYLIFLFLSHSTPPPPPQRCSPISLR